MTGINADPNTHGRFQDRTPIDLYSAATPNGHKVSIMLEETGMPYTLHAISFSKGEQKTPEFLAMNPNGKVPLLRLPDGRYLAESNAMLLCLAEGSPLLPDDPYRKALVHQWLFWEQYSHEPYVAVARFLLHFDHGLKVSGERLAFLHERGREALALMEHLDSVGLTRREGDERRLA